MAEAGWYDDPTVPGQKRYWDGTVWTEHVHQPVPPPPPPPTLPPPPPQPLATSPVASPPGERTTRQKIAVGVGLVTILGCFLPWARAGVFQVDGTDGEDWIFFMGLGIALAWLSWARERPGWTLALSGVIAALGLAEVNWVNELAEDDGIFSVEPGAGLVLIVIAGIVGIVDAIAMFRAAKRGST